MADNNFQPVLFNIPGIIERIIPQRDYHGPNPVIPFLPDPPIDFACDVIIGMPLVFAKMVNFLRGDQESTGGMPDGQLVMNTISSTGRMIMLRILVCDTVCILCVALTE